MVFRTPWIEDAPGGVRLRVYVQPRARTTEVVGMHGDALKIKLQAPPVDGAANDALCRFLADRLGVAQASVRLIGGEASRQKVVLIDGTAQHVAACLQPVSA